MANWRKNSDGDIEKLQKILGKIRASVSERNLKVISYFEMVFIVWERENYVHDICEEVIESSY